jgi:ribosome-binding factor A
MRRVNEAVREVVSNAVTLGLKDPRIGFVTITSVKTSPDLRTATVYVSVFGDDQARQDTLDGLTDSRKQLQNEIAAHLRLKNTPVLTFAYDDSVDRGMRVTELINKESREFESRGEDKGQGENNE